MAVYISLIEAGAEEASHDDIKIKARAIYMEQLALLNAEPEGKTWFFNIYTVCDSYFFWIYNHALEEQFELEGFEHCTQHYQRMIERPSVKRVLAHLRD